MNRNESGVAGRRASRQASDGARGRVSIEDLVGAKVVTASGVSRGRVVDVRTTPAPELRVIGLIVGAWSWLERLRVAPVLRLLVGRRAGPQEIEWASVVTFDAHRIVLRGEQQTREVDIDEIATSVSASLAERR